MVDLLRTTGHILEQQVIPNATSTVYTDSKYGYKQIFGMTNGTYVAERFGNASARLEPPFSSWVLKEPTFVCFTQKLIEDYPGWNRDAQRARLKHGDYRYLDRKYVKAKSLNNGIREMLSNARNIVFLASTFPASDTDTESPASGTIPSTHGILIPYTVQCRTPTEETSRRIGSRITTEGASPGTIQNCFRIDSAGSWRCS